MVSYEIKVSDGPQILDKATRKKMEEWFSNSKVSVLFLESRINRLNFSSLDANVRSITQVLSWKS